MAQTNKIKGFSDFTGAEAGKRERILRIIQRQFELYGFEVAETPIIESLEFVQGENSNDDAVRDVFKLTDRGKRELALRYEFTFQLKRLARLQKLPFKRYQIGYNFRDEPIRQGRTRQFIQCDADIVGSSLSDEVELLAIAKQVFSELEMPVTLYVNNRKLINEILVAENIPEKNREAVIRELDKLDKLSKKQVADNLKKYNAEKVLKIFTGSEGSFEKYSFYSEIKKLKKMARLYGVVVEFRPYLARGFSYYNGTVFEAWSKDLGVSLVGGGSYLVNEIQSSGISFGLEPLAFLSKLEGKGIEALIICLGEEKAAVMLAQKLRSEGIRAQLLLDKTIGKALEYANARGVANVIFVGDEEVSQKKFKIKNMKSGKEKIVSGEKVVEYFK